MTSPVPWAAVAAVAGGSAAGALLRWRVGIWLNQTWAGFPMGTLAVNCAGGLLVGVAVLVLQQSSNETLRLLLVTGFLGGLTTFSAFAAESLLLLQRGAWMLAAGHTLAHVAGSLACATIGFRLGHMLLR